MKKSKDYNTLFIDLDCLLDTRLPTVHINNPELVTSILNNNYHDRIKDLFYQGYEQDYEKRNLETLKQSFITPMGKYIKEFSLNNYFNSGSTPFVKSCRIKLNIHPYKIDNPEWLIKAIVSLSEGKSDVEIVNMPKKDITPVYLKNHVQTIVMYDYIEWLELHTKLESFNHYTCPEIKMIAPAIYFKELTKEQLHSNEDPFSAMELLAGHVIGLQLIPIRNFSFVLPEKKKQESDK